MNSRLLVASATVMMMIAGLGGAPASELSAPSYGAWGLDLAGGDPVSRPGDDFFRHANGVWADRTPIPGDRARYGVDDVLTEIAEAQVRDILENGATGVAGEASLAAAKSGTFYTSFVDEARAEALDLAPIAADLDKVRAASSRDELAGLMGAVNATFLGSIFNLDISPDAKDPNRYAVTIGQAGLGLPDRDYYLAAQFADKKSAYEAYVADILKMAGWDRPDEAARAVLAFESSIAEVSWTKTEDRDSEKLYNPTSVADLAKAAPFAWPAYLAAAGLQDLDRVVVLEDTAVTKIAALYAAAPLDTLKTWQAFHLTDGAAPFLSKRFVALNFAFRQKTLSGVSEIPPRWRRAVDTANANLGEAIGRVYVTRYFPTEAKAQIDALVALCRVAFRHRIERVDWMSQETKARALNKLEHLRAEIAYPSTWRDYATLGMRADDLAGNLQSALGFDWRRRVARAYQAVDRTEWFMTPQTVDAYNDSSLNAIFFPAAILQRPYFDPQADTAVNYGGIAAIIGHEMTHSFDDDGRKYDETGRLSNWWTLADAQEFRERTAKLGRQYDAFEPLPGLHVNGDLTMGENIADLGGALIALDAYHLSLQGKPAPVIDGLTGDQRFFLSYAQSWRDKTTDDEARQRLVSNPHAPEIYRVNGVVRNMDAWYDAFDVKPTDKLYLAPENRARIW